MKLDKLGVVFVAPRFAQRSVDGTDSWVGTVGSNVTEPTSDDFYVVDNVNLESYSKGDIIRHREVGFGNLSSVSSGYQLMYRSENSFGEAITSLTTLILPSSGTNNKMVSYQFYEDAAYLNCAPSYELLSMTLDDVQALLDEGWAVNVPDHEGMNSSFCAGWLSGKLTLDSIRAVNTSSNITGYNTQSNVALWGYSGGSIASGWAAEIQPSYAPDVQLSGIAVGGYVVDLRATVKSANGGPFVGFIPAGLGGLASEYPQIWDTIKAHTNSSSIAEIMKVYSQCAAANILQFIGKDVFQYFDIGEKILDASPIGEIMTNNSLGQNVPAAPMYIYQGTKDEIAPISDVDTIVEYYCKNGAHIYYSRVANSDHFTTQSHGQSQALQWLKLALSGTITNSSCAISNDGSGDNSVFGSSSSAISSVTASVNATATGSGEKGSGSSSTSANSARNLQLPGTFATLLFGSITYLIRGNGFI